KERVKVLEDKDGVIGDKSGDDAPIKGRSNTEGEAPAERIINDSEEIARVLTSMDAATVLEGESNVPTGNGFIPTAAPTATIVSTGSEVGPTASPIIQRRKRKEIIMESDTPKKKKLQEQIDAQDRATIAKSSTLPRDSAPRVTSPAAEEGSMQQTINELTDFYTSLQRKHSKLLAKFQAQEVEIIRLKERVKVLEDKDGVIGDKSRDDAPIKGRSTTEGEAPAERIINDSEEIARVLTSMDAATRKEIMMESDTPKKKKLQEQIDAQVDRELEE
nr:hypothetical protein [Tanacetum cinerariifolium]